MEKIIRLINGVPTAVLVSTGAPSIYDESILVTTDIGVAGTGYNSAHTIFTLPNGMTYDGTKSELQIFIGDYVNGGSKLIEGVDFTYGITSSETTITLIRAVPKNIRVGFVKIS
jgi:hypothetical protein